jgi:DNA-binding NtrC family response regulator
MLQMVYSRPVSAGKPFIAVNWAAIPETLLESELSASSQTLTGLSLLGQLTVRQGA